MVVHSQWCGVCVGGHDVTVLLHPHLVGETDVLAGAWDKPKAVGW